jgi:hypothetical protein
MRPFDAPLVRPAGTGTDWIVSAKKRRNPREEDP